MVVASRGWPPDLFFACELSRPLRRRLPRCQVIRPESNATGKGKRNQWVLCAPADNSARKQAARAPHPSARPNLILRFVIAGFPAIRAIVLPVLGQPGPVVGVAERAVFRASAALLRLVTDCTFEFYPSHRFTASVVGDKFCSLPFSILRQPNPKSNGSRLRRGVLSRTPK